MTRPAWLQPTLGDCLGAGLLLAALAAMAESARRWGFLALFAALLLPALLAPRRLVVRNGMVWVYLGLPVAVLARVWPVQVHGLDLSLGFYLALYLVIAGTVTLAGPRGPARMSRLIGCSGFALAGVGLDAPRQPYLVAALVWGAFALAALRVERGPATAPAPALPAAAMVPAARGRALGAAVALSALVLALSTSGVGAIDAVYEDVNKLFFRAVRALKVRGAPGGGYSGQAQLGSVVELQGRRQDVVAIRVHAEKSPGYLRGRAFLRWVPAEAKWTVARPEAPEGRRRPASRGRLLITGRAEPPADRAATLAIHPSAQNAGTLFLPLEAGLVDGAPDEVVEWPGGGLSSPDGAAGRGYEVIPDWGPWLEDGAAADWLDVPDDPRLHATLDRVLREAGLTPASAPPPEVAVTALVRWIGARYRYQLGIELETGKDPVVQFLEEKREGHCELFAAAGTLLLRRAGVPARYVTGFVCDEKNAWGDVWVARNKHAHAWTEVFHPARGWSTVELTPAGGVPRTPASAAQGGLGEWLEALADRVAGLARRVDLSRLFEAAQRGLARAGGWFVAAWWRPLLPLAVVAALLARWVRRRRAARPVERTLPPALQREREAVQALDRRLAARGLGRGPAETLHEWAARVEQAPDVPDRDAAVSLIRGYAGRRYAPTA